MVCMICKTDGNRIESRSSDSFLICVPCVDAKVEEIAEMRERVAHFNSDLVEDEALMTYEEMTEIRNE